MSWGGFFIGRKRKKAWKVAPLYLFGTICRERNRRAFENCESLDHSFKSSFLYLFWDWIRLYIGDGLCQCLILWIGQELRKVRLFVFVYPRLFTFWLLVYIV